MNHKNTCISALTHLTKIIRASLSPSEKTIVAPINEGALWQEETTHFNMAISPKNLVSRFWTKLKKRKKLLMISALWALAIILVVIKVHWLHYLQNPRYSVYGIPLSYRGPQMGSIDILILGIVSALIGVLLSEADYIFIGYILAFTMSFVGLVVYVVLYIWYVLDWGELLSLIPGTAGLELVILWGILNVTWIMFPAAVLISLFGAIAGGLLRSWLKP